MPRPPPSKLSPFHPFQIFTSSFYMITFLPHSTLDNLCSWNSVVNPLNATRQLCRLGALALIYWMRLVFQQTMENKLICHLSTSETNDSWLFSNANYALLRKYTNRRSFRATNVVVNHCSAFVPT